MIEAFGDNQPTCSFPGDMALEISKHWQPYMYVHAIIIKAMYVDACRSNSKVAEIGMHLRTQR